MTSTTTPIFAFFRGNPVENYPQISWKSSANLRGKLSSTYPPCVNLHFFTDFSRFSHTFSHRSPSLDTLKLFHYSTAPTIITTNNFIERI